MQPRLLSAIGALLWLGCMTSYAQRDDACLTDLKVLPQVTLSSFVASKKGALEIDFAKQARCFRSGDNASPAIVVRLERPVAPALHVTSKGGKDTTLPARVRLLDDQYQELGDYSFDRFVKRNVDFGLTVFLEDKSQARFLLITPDPTWLNRIDKATLGSRSMAFWSTGRVSGTITNGDETRKETPFTGAGQLHIEAEVEERSLIRSPQGGSR